LRVCYADGYYAPLPEGHRFPMGKFSALHRILLSERLMDTADVIEPVAASWADLATVHTSRYLGRSEEWGAERTRLHSGQAMWVIGHFVEVQEVMLHFVGGSLDFSGSM